MPPTAGVRILAPPGDPAPEERLVADFGAEAAPLVRREGGVLVLDEGLLDKPDARAIDLTARHRSGKHRRVVRGSNRITRLWTAGAALLPCRALLAAAKARGFTPACVVFDRWYASLANRKASRAHGWRWAT